jgi:hypothetical protein
MPDDEDDIDNSIFSVSSAISVLLHKKRREEPGRSEQIAMALTLTTAAGWLLTTKAGLDGIVMAYNAAKSVYGWMGGMDGIKFLMSKIPSPIPGWLQESQIGRNQNYFQSELASWPVTALPSSILTMRMSPSAETSGHGSSKVPFTL